MKPKESTTRKTRTMDVRPLIAAGEHPLQKIMEMIATLGPTDELVLLTPFLPAPLIEKLGSEGFHARPERRADGAWQTHFARG